MKLFYEIKVLKRITGLFLILLFNSCGSSLGESRATIFYSDKATLGVSTLFVGGAVLKKESWVPIYGTCNDGQMIKLIYRESFYETPCLDEQWKVMISTGSAGGPWPLIIQGEDEEIEVPEVYVGTVWLAAGQSNMMKAESFKQNVINKNLRVFCSSCNDSQWDDLTSQNEFSVVAGSFSSLLQEYTGEPVGVVVAAKGFSSMGCWTESQSWGPNYQCEGLEPTLCFNTWIKPLGAFNFSGVLWWQGESEILNCDPMAVYDFDQHLLDLITEWRIFFQIEHLPFFIVQLQSIHQDQIQAFADSDYSSFMWSSVRDAQRRVASYDPWTSIVVTFDLTDGQLHPDSEIKEKISQRLMDLAKALIDGSQIDTWSPYPTSFVIENNFIKISFDNVEETFLSWDNMISQGFEVMDYQVGIYEEIASMVEGANVFIDISNRSGPFRVRYASGEDPQGNLFNLAEYPLIPFESEWIE